MNIIFVSNATARARTLTFGWRHVTAAAVSLLVVLVAFSAAVNYAALRWAVAVGHPWLQALVVTDSRREEARTYEREQGYLNAMAIRLGELQAQMLLLDGLGERLAKAAGLKPQELPTLPAGSAPGRGGAESSLPGRNLTVGEVASMLAEAGRKVAQRADQLTVLEALLVQTSANRMFLPTLPPVVDGWYSSNFGFRIDPFSGQSSFHEGIDFLAETGTPVVAAASGKVVFAGWHPQYGKVVEVDHGNGLLSRYAHASRLAVAEGDLVIRGQHIANVGSSGRSTGPHLHFEVRLNGVPQNPARFLRASN